MDCNSSCSGGLDDPKHHKRRDLVSLTIVSCCDWLGPVLHSMLKNRLAPATANFPEARFHAHFSCLWIDIAIQLLIDSST